MDRLTGMEVFTRVAQSGSFSTAARQMGMSKSAASKHVAELETRLGVRLLNRTTRRLALTEAGRAYVERCQRILEDLNETELSVRDLHREPRGMLKLTAPVAFASEHLAPALPAFLAQHPHIEIDMHLSDRFVDLLDEGFDLALRIGRLADSSLVARRIGQVRRIVCAAPSYLKQHGAPETPAALRGHNCLHYTNISLDEEWRFTDKAGAPIPSAIAAGSVRANDGQALRAVAVAGAGIVSLPDFLVAREIHDGKLTPLLEAYAQTESPIHAVYPHNRHLSGKVRAFVDFLAESFAGIPGKDNFAK